MCTPDGSPDIVCVSLLAAWILGSLPTISPFPSKEEASFQSEHHRAASGVGQRVQPVPSGGKIADTEALHKV